ncbi:MAG: hypothetical protein AABX00_01675 [Nanoarchaeota archaeon]
MRDRKEKKKIGLMLFIVIIMIGTSFGVIFYGFSPASNTAEYNGMTFVYRTNGNIWTAEVNGKNVAFSFPPQDVEKIHVEDELASRLKDRLEIDTTYDLNATNAQWIALAQHQMGLVLFEYDVYLRQGFTSNNTYNYPVITCADSIPSVPVIYFKEGNETKVYLDGNCIIAESSSDADFLKIKDRMLYEMLGVIK